MKKRSDREVWHQVVTPDSRPVWLGWGLDKNRELMSNPSRNISFEHVLIAVGENGIEAFYEHPTRPDQWVLEATINGYTYVCPCKLIEGENHETGLFLKTCYPSRKAERRKGRGDSAA